MACYGSVKHATSNSNPPAVVCHGVCYSARDYALLWPHTRSSLRLALYNPSGCPKLCYLTDSAHISAQAACGDGCRATGLQGCRAIELPSYRANEPPSRSAEVPKCGSAEREVYIPAALPYNMDIIAPGSLGQPGRTGRAGRRPAARAETSAATHQTRRGGERDRHGAALSRLRYRMLPGSADTDWSRLRRQRLLQGPSWGSSQNPAGGGPRSRRQVPRAGAAKTR